MDIFVSNISKSRSNRASYLEVGSFSVTDKMTGFMAMMKNTCQLAENAGVWFIVELQFNGAFAPIFKHSKYLKYYKIMTRAPLLYALFKIRGEEKWFWVDRFSHRYASGGATCLRAETTIFSPTRSLVFNLRVTSSPDMYHGCRSVLLNIYGPSGPITFTSPLCLSLSPLYVTWSSKLSHLHPNVAPH
jgi:hypothetical protein